MIFEGPRNRIVRAFDAVDGDIRIDRVDPHEARLMIIAVVVDQCRPAVAHSQREIERHGIAGAAISLTDGFGNGDVIRAVLVMDQRNLRPGDRDAVQAEPVPAARQQVA